MAAGFTVSLSSRRSRAPHHPGDSRLAPEMAAGCKCRSRVHGKWAVGEILASADNGLSLADCNWRPPPDATIPSAARDGTENDRRDRKRDMPNSSCLEPRPWA